MRKFYFTALLVSVFILSACSSTEETEEEIQDEDVQSEEIEHETPLPKEIVPKETPSKIETIFQAKRVGEETFVSHVEAGDLVRIRFSGKQAEDRFSSAYTKQYTSKWKENRCWRDVNASGVGSTIICGKVEKTGTCSAYYRDHLNKTETRLEFKDDPKEIPLRFGIGNHIYHIGDIEEHSGNFISASLEVGKEMLQESKKLYLLPVHDLKGKVTVGFLDFKSCDGHGEKDFHFQGPIQSDRLANEVKRTFIVSLQIIKRSQKKDSF